MQTFVLLSLIFMTIVQSRYINFKANGNKLIQETNPTNSQQQHFNNHDPVVINWKRVVKFNEC